MDRALEKLTEVAVAAAIGIWGAGDLVRNRRLLDTAAVDVRVVNEVDLCYAMLGKRVGCGCWLVIAASYERAFLHLADWSPFAGWRLLRRGGDIDGEWEHCLDKLAESGETAAVARRACKCNAETVAKGEGSVARLAAAILDGGHDVAKHVAHKARVLRSSLCYANGNDTNGRVGLVEFNGVDVRAAPLGVALFRTGSE